MSGLLSNWTRRLLAIGVILLPALGATSVRGADQAPIGKAFLWEVTAANARAYLFGTIHVGRKDFYPLPPQVDKALEASDALVVEVDTSDTQKIVESAKATMYTPPDGLAKHVSKETLDGLTDVLDKLELPPQIANQIRPAALGFTLGIWELQRYGYSAAQGVEQHLLKAARNLGKPILELESAEFQMQVMNSFAPEEEESILKGALAQVKSGKYVEIMQRTVAAWRSGDVSAFEQAVKDSNEDYELLERINEKFNVQRNRAMADKIEGFLRDGKSVFVGVGALHLVGQQSVVDLLRLRGYNVDQR